jgi:transcriptional regulator with XRE-family HTH domain
MTKRTTLATGKRGIGLRYMTEIGERLRWLREAYEGQFAEEAEGHNSQVTWARLLDVRPSQLSRWENGKQLPQMDTLYRLIYITGADWNYVFAGVISETMLPFLQRRLREAHGPELVEPGRFFRERDDNVAANMRGRGLTPPDSDPPERPRRRSNAPPKD